MTITVVSARRGVATLYLCYRHEPPDRFLENINVYVGSRSGDR